MNKIVKKSITACKLSDIESNMSKDGVVTYNFNFKDYKISNSTIKKFKYIKEELTLDNGYFIVIRHKINTILPYIIVYIYKNNYVKQGYELISHYLPNGGYSKEEPIFIGKNVDKRIETLAAYQYIEIQTPFDIELAYDDIVGNSVIIGRIHE